MIFKDLIISRESGNKINFKGEEMMNEIYQKPILIVVCLSATDAVRTSGREIGAEYDPEWTGRVGE